MDFSVVLVGAGNMGGAMLQGWVANGMKPENISVLDPSPSGKMAGILEEVGVISNAATDGIRAPDVLLIALKPQVMDAVLPGLESLVGKDTVIVSVAAGKTLEAVSKPFGSPAAIRAMPNTPALVRRGITVACPNSQVTKTQRNNVDLLLQANGKVEWVEDEKLIDAVTAVSGSGPAYVFHLAECMANAGVAVGLPKDLAMRLARETVAGAGELMRLSEDEPAVLRQNVTSPNGTTAAALEILMPENAMPDLLMRAIRAAKKRSQELS